MQVASWRSYPNPANEEVSIDFGETIASGRIELVGMLGQVLLYYDVENQEHHKMNVSALTQGEYILRFIKNDDTVIVKPILIY